MRLRPALCLGFLAAAIVLVAGGATGAPVARHVGPPRARRAPTRESMTRTSMRVVITAPSAKRRLAGKVRFRAKVLGGRTITRVEFRINGRLRWTDRTKPYAFRGMRGRWNTAAVRTGTHVLQVVAYDRAGRRVGARRVVRIVRGRRGRAAPQSPPRPAADGGRASRRSRRRSSTARRASSCRPPIGLGSLHRRRAVPQLRARLSPRAARPDRRGRRRHVPGSDDPRGPVQDLGRLRDLPAEGRRRGGGCRATTPRGTISPSPAGESRSAT